MPMNDSLDLFAGIIENIADDGRHIPAVRNIMRYSETESDQSLREQIL